MKKTAGGGGLLKLCNYVGDHRHKKAELNNAVSHHELCKSVLRGVAFEEELTQVVRSIDPILTKISTPPSIYIYTIH